MKINHAIIVAAGTGINGEKLNAFGGMNVGGITQLKRLIVVSERSGIDRFTIIADEDSVLKQDLDKQLKSSSEISWHTPNTQIKLDKGHHLVVQSNLIINPKGLSALVDGNYPEDKSVFLVDENNINPSGISGNGVSNNLIVNGAAVVGAFLFNNATAEKAVLNSMDLAAIAQKNINNENSLNVNITDSYWMQLSEDKNSRKKAEDLLFLNIRKSERGWKSRNINRRISIPISRLLLRTPLTPNMISALVGAIGILSGFFYIWGYIVVAGILLELSSILDGCDGEVAKIKLMESKYGQWIDTIYDQISYIFFIIGVPLGYYLTTGSSLAIVLGGINIGIILLSIIWGFYFVAKYAGSGSMVHYPSTIDKMFPLENRSFIYRLIVLVRPLIQREYFAFIIFVASVFGGYLLVLSITTFTMCMLAIHLLDDFIMTLKIKDYPDKVLESVEL